MYLGVVRAEFFDQHLTSTGQSKTRIGISDTGTNFMDINTPRKVIYVFYDSLEGELCHLRSSIRALDHTQYVEDSSVTAESFIVT